MYKWFKRAGAALSAAAITIPLVAGTASADPPTTVNLVAYIQSSQLSAPLAGSFTYWANGQWNAMPMYNSTTGRVAVAPNHTYPVRAVYEGTSETESVVVGSTNKAVWFHTSMVNIELQGSDNNGHVGQILDLADGSASYYAQGWHTMTGVNANNHGIRQAEMLPGTYSFAATYNGTRDQKVQTILPRNANDYNVHTNNANQIVYFHAALVFWQMQSLNCEGDVDGIIAGDASYYAQGWHTVKNGDPNNGDIMQAEMLPGNYSFAAKAGDQRIQKTATIIEPNPNNGAHADQIVYFNFANEDCLA